METYKVNGGQFLWSRLAYMTPREELVEEMSKIGLGERVPRECKLSESIRYALTAVTARKMGVLLDGTEGEGKLRRLIRPLEGRGYSVQLEVASGVSNSYAQKLAVSTEMVGTREQLVFSPPDHPLVSEIVLEIMKVKASVPRAKLQYMIKTVLVRDFRSVSMCDTGKPYFVPQRNVKAARAFQAALLLAHVENKIRILVPQVDQDLLGTVLDALQEEIEKGLMKIDDEIDNGDTGERSLRGRERDADALVSKIQSYEKDLGFSLEGLKKKARIAQERAALAALQVNTAGSGAQEREDDNVVSFDSNPFL